MSRPYRALSDLLRIPGALPRAGMYSPFRAGRASRTGGYEPGRRRAAFMLPQHPQLPQVPQCRARPPGRGGTPVRTAGYELRGLRWLRGLRGRAVRRCAPGYGYGCGGCGGCGCCGVGRCAVAHRAMATEATVAAGAAGEGGAPMRTGLRWLRWLRRLRRGAVRRCAPGYGCGGCGGCGCCGVGRCAVAHRRLRARPPPGGLYATAAPAAPAGTAVQSQAAGEGRKMP